jgi:hypothetical protein
VIRFFRWWNTGDNRDEISLTAHFSRKRKEFGLEARTDYSLFLVVAYVIVDYVLRNYSSVAFLAGLWDELCVLAIIGIWIIRVGVQNLQPSGTRFLVPFLIYLCVYLFIFFDQLA